MKQTVELAITHSQIALYDESTYDDSRFNWGKLNENQDAVLHPDSLIFNPLSDWPFDIISAFIHLSKTDSFELDKQAKRAIVSPFKINDPDHLEIGSVPEQFKVELNLKPSLYQVYFEICENEEKEENRISYKFTLLKQPSSEKIIRPRYLLGDPWGGEKDKELVIGKADKPFIMELGRMQRYLCSLGISITRGCQIFTDIAENNRSQIKRSIGWQPPGGCHCIAYDFEPDEGWSVFYAERGGRFDIQTFANEDDACYAFIYRVA